MRVLEGEARIETRYGGGLVQSIEGVEGEQRGGRSYDWFFFVNGVESPIGAADFDLDGGERIWWDYRDWTAASRVPAVVGSWPAPLRGGYGGHEHPVVLECEGGGGACTTARAALEGAGVELSGGSPPGAIRVLVGPRSRPRSDPARNSAPEPARAAPPRRYEAPPTWLVTGATVAAVRAAAGALDAA